MHRKLAISIEIKIWWDRIYCSHAIEIDEKIVKTNRYY